MIIGDTELSPGVKLCLLGKHEPWRAPAAVVRLPTAAAARRALPPLLAHAVGGVGHERLGSHPIVT